MMTIEFSGAEGRVTVPETITTGMVGKQIRLLFSDEWKGLAKTAVFTAGRVTRDVVCREDVVIIPWEVLKVPMASLYVGAFGTASGGLLAIPTIRVNCGKIQPGVDPSGDPATDADPALWTQVGATVGDLSQLNTQRQNDLVTAVNEVLARCEEIDDRIRDGATFTPEVSAEGVISWSNDRGLDNPQAMDIRGPQGEAGRSAYDYAQVGGFAGTEEDFARRMAADIYTREEIDDILTGYVAEVDALIGGDA